MVACAYMDGYLHPIDACQDLFTLGIPPFCITALFSFDTVRSDRFYVEAFHGV